MRDYVTADRQKAIWYEDAEIEDMMVEHLAKAGLMPTEANCVVDPEALLERHLKCLLDQYAELPADVLGQTDFDPRSAPAVKINRDLTGVMESEWVPPGIEGRWRATLAHEAAHVILHRILFDAAPNQPSLFPGEATSTASSSLLRCLKRDLGPRARNADWREVQANKGMAALLMPRKLFGKVARSTLTDCSEDTRAASKALATRFAVSRQAATIRLRTLGFIKDDAALDLDLADPADTQP